MGVGPIEVLWQRLSRRMISLDRATALARASGVRGDLVAPYACALGHYAVRSGWDGEGAPGVQLSTLLLAAADAAESDGPPARGWTAWRWAADAFVETSATALCDVPDGRLFAEAKETVERIVTWAAARGSHERALA